MPINSKPQDLDTGKLGQAVSMYGNAAGTDGSTLTFNRGAQISGNNYEHINANQGTISFWVKPPSNFKTDGLDNTFFQTRTGTGFIKIVESGGGTLYFLYGDGSGNKAASVDITSWTSANFYHVVARWDVDNKVDGTNYLTIRFNNGTDAGYSTAPITAVTFGANNFIGSNSVGTQFANSLIDDFAIFDRVLTSTEITSIYNTGTGREAGYVADPSLKFYAKMDGTGTLSPVTYNLGSNVDNTAYNSSTNTNGNMITNGNMEAATGGAPTGWTSFGATVTEDAETANILHDTRSQKLSTTSNTMGIYQDITVTGSTNYHFEGWMKVTVGSAAIRILDNTNGGTYLGMIYPTSSWSSISTEFKTAANTTSIRIKPDQNGVDASTFYLDNLYLTPSLVNNGGMEVAGAGVPDLWSGWDEYASSGTLSDETSIVHSGGHAVKMVSGSGFDTFINGFSTVVAGNSYLLSFYTRGDGTRGGQYRLRDVTNGFVNIIGQTSTGITGTTYTRVSVIFKAPTGCSSVLLSLIGTGSGVGSYVYYDDISIIPLDNVSGSLKQWTPVNDASIRANPLSISGNPATGVTSNATGPLNNAYTFDGSTGYLRQKTYAVNIGTLSYGTNTFTDDGQTFTSYKAANPATYMIVITNSDNTTSWGYIGAAGAATLVNVYTTIAESVAGFNGTSPTGKTPVGYEIRKTDYQITGSFTLGTWMKSGRGWAPLFVKGTNSDTASHFEYLLYLCQVPNFLDSMSLAKFNRSHFQN